MKRLLILLLLAPVWAAASPITTDQWYSLSWSALDPTDNIPHKSDEGSLVTGGNTYTGQHGTQLLAPGASPFSFSNDVRWNFIFVGMGVTGDQWDVLDNGQLIGITSNPVSSGWDCGNDPHDCFYGFSAYLKLVLEPGQHSLSMVELLDVNFSSSRGGPPSKIAAMRFDVWVAPEPSAWTLFAIGLVALVVFRARTLTGLRTL